MSKANERSLIPDPNALPALLKKKDDPRLEQLAGSKELHVLKEILARLSAQAGHGNRILEAHHVLLLHLLGFYNPMMRSLRTFELASQHRRVQEVVGLDRVCRSTHSDFLAVADPEILMPVVRALRKKVPTAGELRDDADLGTLLDNVVAYDGSYFEVPVSVAWAMQMHMPHPAKRTAKKTAKALPEADADADADAGQRADRPMRKRMARIRLNLHWATRRGVPLGVSLDGAKGSESAAFIKALEADVIYGPVNK
ncbi:MAG: hypothetical protein ACP5O7_00475 [Phycisphaerae bacterium]